MAGAAGGGGAGWGGEGGNPKSRSAIAFSRTGKGKEMTGANGEDALMRVPVGTQIYEEDGEMLICDLDRPGARVLLLKGGNGGFGNAHFKSATNQAPRHANPGQPAEEKVVILK